MKHMETMPKAFINAVFGIFSGFHSR